MIRGLRQWSSKEKEKKNGLDLRMIEIPISRKQFNRMPFGVMQSERFTTKLQALLMGFKENS